MEGRRNLKPLANLPVKELGTRKLNEWSQGKKTGRILQRRVEIQR